MNIIGELSITDSVVDFTDAPELDGAIAVKTLNLGGVTYVYVAAANDDGLQVLRLETDGTLTPVGSFADTAGSEIRQPRDLEIVQSGDNFYLIVPGADDYGVSTFRITREGVDQGQLTLADTISNDVSNPLEYPHFVKSFSTENGSYVAVSSYYSDAVAIYRVGTNGSLNLIDSVADADDANFRLVDTDGISIHSIGNKTFLYAASDSENGLTVFEISANGTMSYVTNIAHPIEFSTGIEAGSFNGQDFLIIPNDGGTIAIYTLDANGVPTFASTYNVFSDTGDYEHYRVDIIEIEGVSYVVSQASATDTVAIYTLDSSGVMQLVQRIQDVTLLNGAFDIEYVAVGDRHFILATASVGDRITAIEIGGGDDALVGTNLDDQIVGLNGDDDLIGRDGNDLLIGNDGSDVLSGRQGNDTLEGGADADVLIGGAGNDLLEGGADADFVLGGAGTDRISFASSDAAVTVNLETSTVSGGHATGDVISSIEGVLGSAHNDVLTGDDMRNFISGGLGNDTVNGGAGNDVLNGQAGADTVDGGFGNDIISLGGGADIGIGGRGNDRINGGGGNDMLSGGLGDDVLRGAGGADIIDGGEGDDTLDGGGGADDFVFVDGFGTDDIEGFQVNIDDIDFSGHSTFNNFNDVLAAMRDFRGSAIIEDGSNSIQLIGVDSADLDRFDFIFV